jgi:hypothetical protein
MQKPVAVSVRRVLRVGGKEAAMTDNRTAMELYTLRRENAELRKLAREIRDVMWACAEERCPHRHKGCYRVAGNSGPTSGEGECWFERRMSELGIAESRRGL